MRDPRSQTGSVRQRLCAVALATATMACNSSATSTPTQDPARPSATPVRETGATPTGPGATSPSTAAALRLLAPEGVAVDHVGNVFISDVGAELIAKIPPGGGLEWFAGTGASGIADAGVPPLSAPFREPSGLAWGISGGLYVADQHNQRVWRVAGQQVQPVAGTGPTGEGAGGFAGDGGDATAALLNEPLGLVASTAGVYIGDSANGRVRFVAADGRIATVLGGGSTVVGSEPIAGIDAQTGPLGYLALDDLGNLYVAEGGAGPGAAGGVRLLRLGRDGMVTVVAGSGTSGFSGDGGSAVDAELADPKGLALDFAGNLLVCDSGNRRVRRVSPDGRISTFLGNGGIAPASPGIDATNASIGSCHGLAIDPAGAIWIADTEHGLVVEVAPNGSVTGVYGGR